jgi:hypothetical protein
MAGQPAMAGHAWFGVDGCGGLAYGLGGDVWNEVKLEGWSGRRGVA